MRNYLGNNALQTLFGMLLALWISVGCNSATQAQVTTPQNYLPTPGALLTVVLTKIVDTPTPPPPVLTLTPESVGKLLTVRSPLPTPTPSPRPQVKPTVWMTSTALIAVVKLRPAAPVTTTAPVSATVAVTTPPPLPFTPTPTLQPTPDGQNRTAKVPILMYHYVSVPPKDADIYRLDLSVKPDLFAAQLDRMRKEGYTTISLYDLVANLTQGAPLPPKPVILTFDDGYRDAYENAFPLLKARSMKATFFVITDFIDQKQPEYLTWDMAREMLAAGMSIESHSRNHASLRKRNKDFLVWQALGSLETIKYELGVQPHFICYPAGEYDQATIDVFKSANYWAGITTMQGATHQSDDLFELHRVRIRGTTTPDDLARLLSLDW